MVKLSSAEIAVLVNEVRPMVNKAFVKNVYIVGHKSVVLKLFKPGVGTFELLLAAGSAFFCTDKNLPKPEKPSDQTARLRKLITGLKIAEMMQKGFERIIEIKFHKDNLSLLTELMPPGNLVLLKDEVVIWALESFEKGSRPVRKGFEYKLPAQRFSVKPGALPEDFFKLLNPSSPIIASLSRDLGLGGKYAEEVLLRAGVDKQANTSSLADEQKRKIADALSDVLKELELPRPVVYFRDDEAVPSAVMLKSLANFRHMTTNTFSEAVMTAYLHEMACEQKAEAYKQLNEKIRALEKMRGDRLYVVQALEAKKKDLETLIDKVLSVSRLFEDFWTEPEQKSTLLQKHVGCKTILNQDLLHLEMGEAKFTFRKGESVHRALGRLYNEVKTLRNTIAKLQQEIIQIEEEIRKTAFEKEAISVTVNVRKPEARKPKKPFREFRTSGGFAVMIGRDANSNIQLLKKHLSKDDLVLHADIPGSPATVLKNGARASAEDIQEAAQITACYSRAWREKFSNASVYCVQPSQVSFTPPSGQFLPKGSFMVYGRKTYVTAELRLAAVSLEKEGASIVPLLTARRLNLAYVELRPGKTGAGEAAKTILDLLKIPVSQEDLKSLEAQIPYGVCSVFYQDKLIKS
ncbi:MAG: NFACT family protein [Candidatus Caldarchaeum sp.]